MINLVEVNGDNYRAACKLKVAESQKNYVVPNIAILGRAYAYRNNGAKVYLICNDEVMVGMAFYRQKGSPYSCYILDQFMIDERYQGKGYGEQAVKLIIHMLKTEGNNKKIELCYCKHDLAAQKLYEKLGFYHTGEIDGEEIIMALNF